jgi:hypothetical protein
MVEIGRKKVGISPNSFSIGCTKLENGKIVEYMPYNMPKHTQKPLVTHAHKNGNDFVSVTLDGFLGF